MIRKGLMKLDDVGNDKHNQDDDVTAKDKKNDSTELNQNKVKENSGIVAVIICLVLIALGGIGFGMWAVTDGNTKEAKLKEEISKLKQQVDGEDGLEDESEDEFADEELEFGKPDSADQIEAIYITYNDDSESIDVYEDGVEYYAFNDEGLIEESEREIETDTMEIRQFVFDSGVDNLTDETVPDDYDWSIKVDTADKTCMKFGTGDYPDWFKNILDKLNVSENGNYLKK